MAPNPSSEERTLPVLRTPDGAPYEVPPEGSLGLLALGYVGLMLWRQKRHAARNDTPSRHPAEHPAGPVAAPTI